jgi:hypothetical protein
MKQEMKVAIFLSGILFCGSAMAAQPKVEHVLYFGWPADVGTSMPLGDLRGKIQMLLFTAKACPLPVVNAEHMRKYMGATGQRLLVSDTRRRLHHTAGEWLRLE